MERTAPEATPLLPGPRTFSSMDVASTADFTTKRLRRRTTLRHHLHRAERPPMGIAAQTLFLSNLITGPGMLGLPAAFRFGGWLLATTLTVGFAAGSALACAFVAHACSAFRTSGIRASLAPGLAEPSLDHASHVEMETLVRGLGSRVLSGAFQVVFLACMLLMAISCIVVTATSLDSLSVLLIGNAWGLQLSPSLRWVSACDAASAEACSGKALPFAAVAASGGRLLSCGYFLTAALTAPLALIDVSDAFQATAYCLSLVCLLQLIGKFCWIAWAGSAPMPALPPAIGWNAGLALEVSFWSWLVTFAAPMWMEERDAATSISEPLLYSFGHRAVLDLLLGLSGAAAFPHMAPTTLNVLDAVAAHPDCGVLTRACGIGFVVCSLLPNICDYAMVASRNAESHTGTAAANLLGVGVPFASAFLFYFGASFSDLVSALAPGLNGLIQFVVPACLYLAYAQLEEAADGSFLTLLDVRLTRASWRQVALGIACGAGALIVATYGLHAMASAGRIHPPRSSSAAGDYVTDG